METYQITMSGKIRQRPPETPVNRRKRILGPQKNPPQIPPTHADVAGVAARRYQSLPTPLWNEVTSVFADTLKGVAKAFNRAFKHDPEPQLLDLLQNTIPDLVFSLGRQLMEAVLNQVRGFYGTTIRCSQCQDNLQFEGYIERGLKTRLGPIRFKRAYYHGECGHSAFPTDTLLGIDGKHGVLPDLQECAALLATSVSYPQALELLQRLLPIGTFSLHLEEEVTRAVAAEFATLQAEEGESAKPGWRDGHDLQDKTVVASADGGMVRVRDHSEKYREAKLAVMGDLAPNGEVVNKSYVATLNGPNDLLHRANFEYVRKGHDRAARLHFVADGATWIEARVDELLHPGQTLSMVLDWYHATERLKAFADTALGIATEANKAWYEAAKGALYEGELAVFFKLLRQYAGTSGETAAPKELATTLKYFENRRKLLCYKWCRDNGLPIGSGIVEGGIRFVCKDRLDCTGMRWGTPGAGDILHLRCIEASKRWEDFARMRSSRRLQRFRTLKTAWLQAA